MRAMTHARLAAAAVLIACLASPRLGAELAHRDAPIIVSHYHLNVSSIAAHKQFWVETLGGTAFTYGPKKVQAIRFPGVFLFLHEQKPTGPTRGTTFDHIGFAVPDVPAMTTRVVANGYGLTVGREIANQPAAAPATGSSAVYGRFSYLVGPDGVKVELVTADPGAPPIAHHHVHFVNKQYVEMQQWYMKAFDATLRPGQTDYFIGADLPGVGYMLNFFHWELPQDLVGTKGRAVDHIGFEVKNLQEFCKRLEAKGITLTKPYAHDRDMNNIGIAVITDPWGTVIELTEGLRDLE
jgi:catechol 2,3-dioxygenase-like lactoylglutathione lyase family enzyme